MHLITPLISGVRGAEGGTVDIYLRGTSTNATWYTDFEGTASGSGQVALDANGGAELYVNTMVRVLVKTSLGATVRDFVAGDASTAVEVDSDSFTGTPYGGGGSAVSEPTTLAAVLDLVNNSFGASNWQVPYNGAPANLSAIVASLSGQRQFVVTTYGAIGNGVANDQSAINAAISAANAAGGGIVYFPPGVYRTTGAITCFSTVSLVGLDPLLSVVQLDHATAQLITGVAPSSVLGLGIELAQSHSGNVLNITGGPVTGSRFERCRFVGAGLVGTWIACTWVCPTIADCEFYIDQDDDAIVCTVAGGPVVLVNVKIVQQSPAAGTSTLLSCVTCKVNGCEFRTDSVTSGTVTLIAASGNAAIVTGCYLSIPYNLAPAYTVFSVASPAVLYESGNIIAALLTLDYTATRRIYNIGATPSTINVLGSRRHQVLNLGTTLSNADPIVVPAAEAAAILLRNNSTASHSGNVGINIELAPPGSELDLCVWNDTAGAITYQWGTNCVGTATFAVAANSVRTFRLVLVASPTLLWRIMSDTAGSEVAEA